MNNATSKINLTETAPAGQEEKKQGKIDLLDLTRGLALIFILAYHIFLFATEKNILTKATGLKENLERFGNLPNIILATFYQGVHIFIILSGFLLTLSMVKNQLSPLVFYKKRLKRILIPYWLTFIICLALIFLSLKLPFINQFNKPIPLAIGIKAFAFPLWFDYSSTTLSYINRAWWFLPLILELYLVFPFLFKLSQKLKPVWLLALSLLLTLSYRVLATYTFQGSPIGVVYPSLNGSAPFIIFLARLFEFSLGMFLAQIYLQKENIISKLTTLPFLSLGVLLQSLGTVASFYKPGWIISDPLIGSGIFLVALNLSKLLAKINRTSKLLKFLSSISYPVYLIHYLLLIRFFTPLLNLQNGSLIYLSLMPVYLLLVLGLGKVVQILDKRIN